MKTEYDFLDSPLCTWVRSLLGEAKLDYEKFPNGEYFHQLLKRSDPRQNSNSNLPNDFSPSNAANSAATTSLVSNCMDSTQLYDTTYRSRILNLDFILRNIRSFYQDVLNHILLIKLPDIYQIAKYPDSEQTYKEMEKMLLLLLGIAINGEFKAKFIEQIQTQLETNTQMQLVPFIQLVTDDLSFSISKQFNNKNGQEQPQDLSYFLNTKLLPNIQRVIDERDLYLESIIELEQDKDYLLFQSNNNNNNSINDKNNTSTTTNLQQSNQQLNNSDLKHLSINELILNLVNNSNTICKLEMSSSTQTSTHDSLLNETNLISKLIDSIINKELNEDNAAANQQQSLNANDSTNNDDASSVSSQNTSATNLIVRNSSDNNHVNILNDLKNRKSLTNNWNQKIAIELVECKIRLKQLINEM